MTLDDLKNWATLAGTLVAGGAFIFGVYQYQLKVRQDRANAFFGVWKRFIDNAQLRGILDALDSDAPSLADVAFSQKAELLGVYEEVGLLVKSGFVPFPVAFYMFGYFVVKTWTSQNFWKDGIKPEGIRKDAWYWSVGREMAEKMKVEFETAETKKSFATDKVKF